jgi:hypothetical protein
LRADLTGDVTLSLVKRVLLHMAHGQPVMVVGGDATCRAALGLLLVLAAAARARVAAVHHAIQSRLQAEGVCLDFARDS